MSILIFAGLFLANLHLIFCTHGQDYCPDGFVPFTNGLSCISIIRAPLMNYNEAVEYANNRSLTLVPIRNVLEKRILSLNILMNSTLVLWIKSNCGRECNGNNCLSLVMEKIVNQSCTDRFSFAVMKSYDIELPINAMISKRQYIVQYQTYNLAVPNEINSIISNVNSDTTAQWLFDGEPLQNDSVSQKPGYNLYFDSFIPTNHSGVYTLVLSNPRQSVIIFIMELWKATLGEFTVPPVNETIPTGNIAVLVCQSGDSYPPPDMKWVFINSQGHRIDIGARNDTRFKVSSKHSLYIRETKVEDSGEYLCIASNIAGKRSAAAYLTVINTTLLNAPLLAISQNPRNQTVFVGEKYTIECCAMFSMPQSVIATQATVALLINFREIPSPGQVRSRNSLFYYSLMERNFPIMEFEAQEEGEDQFYCHVTANLYVIDQIQVKYSENATITINAKANVKGISTSINNTLISLGSTVNINCDYTGPSVKWYYNSLPYTGTVSNPNSRLSKISISNFGLPNTGTYQCIASSDYQTTFRSITLSAKDGVPGRVYINATVISYSSILLVWSPAQPANTLYPSLLAYEIRYRKLQPFVPVGNFIIVGSLLDTRYVLDGLQSGTLYQINIVARTTTFYGPDYPILVSIKPEPVRSSSTPTSTVTSSTSSRHIPATSARSALPTASTTFIITPSVGNVASSNTPVSTVVLSIVLSFLILIVIIIVLLCLLQRCWWKYKGYKGNYSPEMVEEVHQRNAMLNFEPQLIVPPNQAFESATDLESGSSTAVDVIRVDKLFQSQDNIVYDSLESLQLQSQNV